MKPSSIRLLGATTTALLTLLCGSVHSYPLDGEEESGLRRLKGYLLAQQASSGAKLTDGQLWSVNDIRLNLVNYDGPDFDQLEQDKSLSSSLADMLKKRDSSYSMVLVDFSDTNSIKWAGLRPDLKQNPGSVGKLLCMTALFHALAQAFPNTEDRADVLMSAELSAADWIDREIHKVPKWDTSLNKNTFSVLQQNEIFRLSEWVDHAISASANGAGSVIWREAMLLSHFGKAYPISNEARQQFFKETSQTQLAALARKVITDPLTNANINTDALQQGSFFTASSKQKVAGIMSYESTRELARVLFRIEQGKLVDQWSSLQMKKFLYMTKRRYRYSFAPELAEQAIFFKSGSLYSCQKIEGEQCGKYMGNKQNLMNSIAVIEEKRDQDPKYIATLMSNVLGVNSAWDHSRIGAATDKMIRTGKSQTLKENASELEISESGGG
jgi:hypothetical protein